MPFAVARKSDNTIRSSSRWDRLDHDPGTEVLLELPEMPTADQRWDGDVGLRPATSKELVDADSALTIKSGLAALDANPILMAIIRWTAGKLNVDVLTARREILTIYNNLPE